MRSTSGCGVRGDGANRDAPRGEVGFTEVERFEEDGAEQWFGVWSSDTPSG
ncbi:hypothetical protein [Streptomyces sp. 061-3]|uniref:hypothetical protein n=1 Tax=Streptomyces sp. 061-3 TaxID=2789268 RepID=UPI00397EB300